MFSTIIGMASEIPVSPGPSQKAKPRLRKRSLMFGLFVVTIIAFLSIYALFQSPMLGVGAKVSELRLDYCVGEKMTYETNFGIQMFDATISETIMLKMEVQNFDGENYTLGYTILAGTEEHSFVLKLNQTGHLVGKSELPDDLDETFSYFLGVPGFGSYLTGEAVTVGDSWEIPFDVPETDFEGKISFVITELGKVDVPAGTYDVFKICVGSSGLNIEAEDVQLDLEMDGVLSLEKDTCHLVDMGLTLVLETIIEDQTRNFDITLKMTLVEHLR